MRLTPYKYNLLVKSHEEKLIAEGVIEKPIELKSKKQRKKDLLELKKKFEGVV